MSTSLDKEIEVLSELEQISIKNNSLTQETDKVCYKFLKIII